jgi:penicillin-binding protein 1B
MAVGRLAPLRRAVAAKLRRGLRRVGRAGRDRWRTAPGSARLAGWALVGGAVAAALGVTTWAVLTVERLDLDAAQSTPLVYAAGRRLEPGMSARAIADGLDRLAYREVTGEPGAPGEFRRARGRWEVHLRAQPDVHRPAVRVVLLVEGARVREVAGAPAQAEPLDLEPELLTGIGETGAERRRPLALADQSRFVISAVLAAEDHRFFEHAGVDLVAVGRAFAVNASRGEIAQGASTLTQQLVKNLALGPERSWSRKVREGALAMALERWHPKEKILEAYLNTVYLGQHERAAIHGVGAAAQEYFGKDARRLTAGESALLAGMIRAPNRYSPVEHPERARQRRDVVLRQMAELGFIDRPTLDAALAERVRVRGATSVPSPAPYFSITCARRRRPSCGPGARGSTRRSIRPFSGPPRSR